MQYFASFLKAEDSFRIVKYILPFHMGQSNFQVTSPFVKEAFLMKILILIPIYIVILVQIINHINLDVIRSVVSISSIEGNVWRSD